MLIYAGLLACLIRQVVNCYIDYSVHLQKDPSITNYWPSFELLWHGRKFTCVRKVKIPTSKSLFWWIKVTKEITDIEKICEEVLFERSSTNWVRGHRFCHLLWVKTTLSLTIINWWFWDNFVCSAYLQSRSISADDKTTTVINIIWSLSSSDHQQKVRSSTEDSPTTVSTWWYLEVNCLRRRGAC